MRPWLTQMSQGDDWVGGFDAILKKMAAFSLNIEQNQIRGDYYQKNGKIIVMLEIPGLKEQHEIDIRVDGQILVVQGTTTEHEDTTGFTGESRFLYEMLLPAKVEAAQMETTMNTTEGILTIRLPKS